MGTRLSNEPSASAPAITPAGHPSQRSIQVGLVFGICLFALAAYIGTVRQESWEFPVLSAVNSIAGHSMLLDHGMHTLTSRDLLQGVVFIALFCYLWFLPDGTDRSALLVGLAAAATAGFASRLLQLALPTHLRPLHTAALGFVMPAGVDPSVLNHFNSFPSDHGAVYFTLAIVIWRARPPLGIAAFFWAIVIDLARVYEGYHWPSDVLASVGLSLLMLGLFQSSWVYQLAGRIVAFEQTRRASFYLVAFVIIYQIATLFDDVRQIGRGFASVVLHHDPFVGT